MTDTTPLQNKVLVTGANSGLGKYIASQIDCAILTRENSKSVLDKTYDTIIHCAFNSRKNVNDYYEIVRDNIFLTKDLCKVPHNKFVFISSIDVYQEEDNLYKTSKLMAESIVNKMATNSLTLRCSAILGETMRKNNFRKIIEDVDPKLSLSGESSFNYILQEDILNFLNIAIKINYNGIVDFVSSTNITLKEVSDLLEKKVDFGSYVYRTPELSSESLASVFPPAALTSKQNVKRYLKDM
jgi:nucleoside-diphosphate-sugar epimerase|tara:strand:+ start:77 stop:799 length:723 start_codon:yes stop_codon:yes gene_type:complete